MDKVIETQGENMSKPAVIINPSSANGTTGKAWPAIESKLRLALKDFSHTFTKQPNHATELTRQALKEGASSLIVIGGDGTLSEVVNGYFENGKIISLTPLGILMRGTGRDSIKSLKIPQDLDAAIATLTRQKIKKIDLGKISYLNHQGQTSNRYFINVASFGMAGAVDARVNSTSKALGGLVSFLSATLITLLRYQNQKVKIQIDGNRLEEVTIRNVAIGNGKYFGGGMMICPDAVMDDGIFQVTIVGDISRIGSIQNLGNLYKGSLQGIPGISFYQGKKIIAESLENILLDVDGEQPGRLPATFEIVPQAVNVYIP